MKILLSLIIMLGTGCMSKVVKNSTNYTPNPVHNISFEKADLNSDGDLSKEEFISIGQSQAIDTVTPVIWFVVLIILIGSMVYLTKFLRTENK